MFVTMQSIEFRPWYVLHTLLTFNWLSIFVFIKKRYIVQTCNKSNKIDMWEIYIVCILFEFIIILPATICYCIYRITKKYQFKMTKITFDKVKRFNVYIQKRLNMWCFKAMMQLLTIIWCCIHVSVCWSYTVEVFCFIFIQLIFKFIMRKLFSILTIKKMSAVNLPGV